MLGAAVRGGGKRRAYAVGLGNAGQTFVQRVHLLGHHGG